MAHKDGVFVYCKPSQKPGEASCGACDSRRASCSSRQQESRVEPSAGANQQRPESLSVMRTLSASANDCLGRSRTGGMCDSATAAPHAVRSSSPPREKAAESEKEKELERATGSGSVGTSVKSPIFSHPRLSSPAPEAAAESTDQKANQSLTNTTESTLLT